LNKNTIYEIDIDREIACLVLLYGLAEDATHHLGQVQAFVAWIAAIGADTADCGGGRVEMSKAAAVACAGNPGRAQSRVHCGPPLCQPDQPLWRGRRERGTRRSHPMVSHGSASPHSLELFGSARVARWQR
jgi:hypothetical protein